MSENIFFFKNTSVLLDRYLNDTFIFILKYFILLGTLIVVQRNYYFSIINDLKNEILAICEKMVIIVSINIKE